MNESILAIWIVIVVQIGIVIFFLFSMREMKEIKGLLNGDDEYDWEIEFDKINEWQPSFEKIRKDLKEINRICEIGGDWKSVFLLSQHLKLTRITNVNKIFIDDGNIIQYENLVKKSQFDFIKQDARFINGLKTKLKEKEVEIPFDLLIISKTLHHLRTGKCIIQEEKKKWHFKKHMKIFEFEPEKIIKLFKLAKFTLIWEHIEPNESDHDIEDNGGNFTREEFKNFIKNLKVNNFTIDLISPECINDIDESIGFYPNSMIQLLIKKND
ncbi:MAG: hypothetical protein ACTSRG_21410 [Candidatus Helarchaeota archaeon]